MAGQRIGDAERETALSALGEHFAQGRLTRPEYDERSDAVWTARTADDLAPLFADLPSGSPLQAQAAPPPAPVGSRARRAFRGLPPAAQVALGVVLVLLVLANLPLVLVAGLVWFVLSRHGVAKAPWASGHPGRVRGSCAGR